MMEFDRGLVWISGAGEELRLEQPHFLVKTIDGLGGVEADIQTVRAPYQDGSTLIDQLLQSRNLSIELHIFGDDDEEIQDLRRLLVRVFNPKLGAGLLKYAPLADEGVEYAIRAVSDGSPVFAGGLMGVGVQHVMIPLYCPDPAWFSPVATEIFMRQFEGGLMLPFELPLEFGENVSEFELINAGDISTPVLIELSGPLSEPVIVKNLTTGQWIEIRRNIPSGWRIVIDTGFGRKRVTLIDPAGAETNAFHWVTADSVLFPLVPGVNRLSYFAAADLGGDFVASISYHHRYVGV